MNKIRFKEDSTMTWQNGKPIILHKYSISKELIDIIENENNFNTINHALRDLHIEHMIDGNKSVMVMPIQDYQTQTSVVKAFEDAKNKHDRLIVLFQRLLECANEAKRQEQKSTSAKKDEGQCSEDHEGMYYQQNGTFQKEKNNKSVGLCIISNYKEDIIMSFEEKSIEYKDVDKKSIPSYLEMIDAFDKFKTNLNLLFYTSYWVCSPFSNIAKRSCNSDNPIDDIGYLYLDYYPVFRYYYRGSRLFRKVWRISKV